VADIQFSIPHNYLAQALYRRLYEEFETEVLDVFPRLRAMMVEQLKLISQMSYKTGSINLSSSLVTYLLTRKVKPSVVAEIGTFVGGSTLSMAMAMSDAGCQSEIVTCDKDNPFIIESPYNNVKITGNSFTDSAVMLAGLAQAGRKIDLMFLDGRILPKDVELIRKIATKQTIFLIDDFEGVEKGVVNSLVLKQDPAFAHHILMLPMQLPNAEILGCLAENKVAVLIPPQMLRLTAQ